MTLIMSSSSSSLLSRLLRPHRREQRNPPGKVVASMMNSKVVIQSKHHHHHHHHRRKNNVDHRSRIGLQEQKKSVRGAKLSMTSSSNNETTTENDDDETMMMKDVQVTFVDCVASDGAKMTKETRRNAEGSIEEMDNCRFVRHHQSRRFNRLKVGFVFFSPPFFVKLSLLAIRCNNKKHSFS